MMEEAFPYLRRKDWASRWVRFIKDSLDLKEDLTLDWTDMNCLMWGCQWVEEATGHNPYDIWMGDAEVHSPRDAYKQITSRGYETLDQIVRSHFKEVPIGFAQQGDFVLVKADWEAPEAIKEVMPYGVALADPPHFWCVMPEGLARGDLYVDGIRTFAVGRVV